MNCELIGDRVMVSAPKINDILQSLDQCVDDGTFPILNGGFFSGGIRLYAYRADIYWELLIEQLCYNPSGAGHYGILDALTVAGNYLSHHLAERTLDGQRRHYIHPTGDSPNGPTFTCLTDIYGQYVYPATTDIVVRGNMVSIETAPSAYSRLGIMLEDSPRIRGQELLRWLVAKYPGLLFMSESERREALRGNAICIISLSEWHHPDILQGDLPSRNECFQQLAEVIASGDASRYHPTEPPNTHWSNWPHGGDI